MIELSPATLDAIADRVVAKMRAEQPEAAILPDTLSCAEVAALVGRKAKWVRARCRIRKIKTVAGRRPYRIPASEARRLLA